MIDTQAIRKKILDLALQGKLTEQLLEDGTAEELFQQIQQKKHSKPIKEKAKSEKPFQIPENWKWVHLNEIADTSLGKTLDKSKNTGDLCPYLCSINVHWDGIKLDTVKEARFTEEEKTKYRLAPGDLLICEGGDVGRTAIWNQNTVMYYQNALHRVRFYCNINPWFYRDLFEYYKAVGLLDWFSTGMTIKHLVQSSLYSLWLPLPPLSEQKRIVDKADSMIAILNIIDTLQTQYQDNLATLKSKIIDAGIQGKLTEQLPEDGTAEKLYQQIQQERKNQEERGKIKKEDLFPDIEDQSIPFSVPTTWLWTYLGNVSYIVRGGSPRPIKQYITHDTNGINWIKIGDVEKGGKYIYQTNERIIPEGEKKSRRVYPGDFLFTNSMSFGRPYISQIEGCIHDGWLLIRNLNGFDPDYLYYLLSSSYLYSQFTEKASGSTVDNLNIDKVKSAMIPLPPLAEQKRIVAKLEELLPLCEG